MTAYSASASYGARPAYIDWKLKIRCSRSSSKNDATVLPSLPKPPSLTSSRPGPPRLDQVERRVEVGVDERVHLGPVELLEPRAEPTERRGVLGTGELADLLGHRLATVADEQRRAVGVDGAVHRVDRVDRDEVLHLGAGRVEGVLEQVRHREDGRAVVETEPLLGDIPARPPGMASRSTTVTSWPAPTQVAAADSPPRPAPTTTTLMLRLGDQASTVSRHQTLLQLTYSARATNSFLAASTIGACSIAATAASVRARDVVLELGERAGVDDHLLDAGDTVTVEAGSADAGQHGELLGVRTPDRAGEQRRRLALAEVVADRLAGEALVAERAHHVVAHLERVAERQAVRAERREQFVARARGGEHGAEVQRPLDGVLAGLVPADPLGLVDVADALRPIRGCRGTGRCSARRAARSRSASPPAGHRPSGGRRRRTRGRRRGWPHPRRTDATRRPSRRRRAARRPRCAWSAVPAG